MIGPSSSRRVFRSPAMHHPPCFLSIVVITVCDIDWYTVWILGFVVRRCPFECIRVRDFRQSDKESRLPEISYRRSTLSRCLGDKIADVLEYFLGPFPDYDSTLYNKRLKVYVVQLLVGLKVFEQFCLFSKVYSI